MSTSDNLVLAFDLYGTLLSTESIAQKLASPQRPSRSRTHGDATSWNTHGGQIKYTNLSHRSPAMPSVPIQYITGILQVLSV
ncbi:hypothetical protein BJX99DRAFT_254937 [Aspergillus californicus]